MVRSKDSTNTQFNNGADNFLASASKTRVGWTAGAGGEWMFAPGWSAKFEYLYIDLGKSSAVASDAPLPDPPFQVGYTWHTQDHIVRAGCELSLLIAAISRERKNPASRRVFC